jgi:MFS family permease
MTNVNNNRQYPSKSDAYSTVTVLFFANIMSFIDRQIPAMLVGPIKEDFNITDSQVALLIGFSFAATYAVTVLPVGIAADRLKRKLVLGWGLFLWSFMTMAAMFVTSYKNLIVARMGVAMGETVIAPVAVSLVSDSFPEHQRGKAMGIISAGVYVGIGVSLVGGGYLIDYLTNLGGLTLPIVGHIKPWQGAFVIAGSPGLLVMAAAFALREPTRREVVDIANKQIIGKELFLHIREHKRTLFFLLSALMFQAITFYSFSAWAPTMMVRTYGLSLTEVGVALGSITIIASILGTIIAGNASDRLIVLGYQDGPVRAAMIACALALPAIVLAPLMKSLIVCWILLAVYLFFISSFVTLGLVAVASVATSTLKGQMTAFFALVMMISGIFGPQITAGFTDFIFMDEAKINLSLSITGAISLPIAILLFGLSLPHLRNSVVQIRQSAN